MLLSDKDNGIGIHASGGKSISLVLRNPKQATDIREQTTKYNHSIDTANLNLLIHII
jgi:hypothetical protein